jgi:hypothetical protein
MPLATGKWAEYRASPNKPKRKHPFGQQPTPPLRLQSDNSNPVAQRDAWLLTEGSKQ